MKIIKKNEGLTLVEIVVSLAILGIIITPLATLFVSSVRTNANSEDRMIANQLAQRYMEEMMNDIKTYIVPGSKLSRIDGQFSIEGRAESPLTNYEITRREIPDFDSTFDFTIDASERANDDDIKVEDTRITINTGTPNTITPDDKIDIRINCTGSSDIELDVSNESTKTVNIYKVYSSAEGNKVTINTVSGAVHTYENVYDESVVVQDRNKVYRINVSVSKDGEPVTKLVRFKTIE